MSIKKVACLLAAALFSIAFASNALAEYARGKIMVKFKPDVVQAVKGARIAALKTATVNIASVRSLNAKFKVSRIKHLYQEVLAEKPHWKHLEDNFVLYIPEDADVEAVAKEFSQNPYILSAAPISRVKALATTPNDPYFANGSQYGLTNIKAPAGWDRTTGSSSTLIAVLDTGINYNHEDFAGKINLTDARDFVNNDTNPWDDFGHGTAVAGVIAAATNNGKGIAGVDWNAKILPLKVLASDGHGDLDNIVEAIAWAVAKGAAVVNLSLGQYNNSRFDKYTEENPNGLKDACLDAYSKGVVIVAAAGNGNVDWNMYPAYYSCVLSVAAVDENDARSYWGGVDPDTGKAQASNYGTWVDVCAPGTAITSTSYNGGYNIAETDADRNGTSLAAPFVAGLAGLIKAVNPGITNQQIIDKITREADNIDSLSPSFAGKLGKRINVYLALSGIVADITSPADGAYVKGSVAVQGTAAGWDFTRYRLELLKNGVFVATVEASSSSVEAGTLGVWNTTATTGAHTISLKVTSATSGTEETTVTVVVDNVTPEAAILSPSPGAKVTGAISIVGTAEDQYLDRYVLEYGKGASPAFFETIKTGYISVSAGNLGTWETAGLSGIYTIRLTAYDKAGATAGASLVVDVAATAPVKEAQPQAGLPLAFASPNPFNKTTTAETTFNYSLAGNFDTKIYLFDLQGRLIWQNSYLSGEDGGKAGPNSPSWNGRDIFGANVANGVYLYQVVADNRIIARGKLIVLN